MRARRLRILSIGAAAAVLGFLAPETGQAQTPLTTETLTGTVTVTPPCTFGGNVTNFSFDTSGTAAGPYPGTFTESGSFTVDYSNESLVSFNSTFTINATDGSTVTGQKMTVISSGEGTCGLGGVGTGEVDYTATIVLPDGTTCNDSGTSTVNVNGFPGRFTESFTSSSAGTLTCTPPGGTNNKTAREIAKTLAKCDKAGPDTDKCAKAVAKLEEKISPADFATFTAMFMEMFGMPPP